MLLDLSALDKNRNIYNVAKVFHEYAGWKCVANIANHPMKLFY